MTPTAMRQASVAQSHHRSSACGWTASITHVSSPDVVITPGPTDCGSWPVSCRFSRSASTTSPSSIRTAGSTVELRRVGKSPSTRVGSKLPIYGSPSSSRPTVPSWTVATESRKRGPRESRLSPPSGSLSIRHQTGSLTSTQPTTAPRMREHDGRPTVWPTHPRESALHTLTTGARPSAISPRWVRWWQF